MNQLALLDPLEPTDRPIARRLDPSTSKQAARQVTLSGLREAQRRIAVDLVRRFPGRTSWELSGLVTGRSAEVLGSDRDAVYYALARRLPDARPELVVNRRDGLHGPEFDEDKHAGSKSGSDAIEWWPAGGMGE